MATQSLGFSRYQAAATARPHSATSQPRHVLLHWATSDKVTKIAKYSEAILSGLQAPVAG